ncbi:hypothetical protein JL721_10305 [Aureococcus anophagefferens]|nr:hypothetical protein JL721_10305 [Aureococcus anophagefferens]
MIEATDHYLRVPTTIEPDFADRTVRAKWRSLHKNCKLIAIYGFLFHAGWSTWERNVFPVFLDESMGRRSVGFVQSLQGLVARAPPPDLVRPLESVRGARNFTVAVGVVALAAGIFTDSVLASSAARGPERQFAFVAKSTLWRLGNVAGQAANLAFFAVAGDDWALGGLRKIMAIGVVLCLSVALLAAVRDPPPEEPDLSRPLLRGGALAPPLVPRPSLIILGAVVLRVVGKGATMRRGFGAVVSFTARNPDRAGTSPCASRTVSPQTDDATAIVLAAQVLSVGAPLACDALARAVGRAPTMVLVRLIEPAALAALALAGVRVSGGAFLCYLGVPVGTRAIEKAVLMDHTAKKSRGRWNAVESVNRAPGRVRAIAFLVHDTATAPPSSSPRPSRGERRRALGLLVAPGERAAHRQHLAWTRQARLPPGDA